MARETPEWLPWRLVFLGIHVAMADAISVSFAGEEKRLEGPAIFAAEISASTLLPTGARVPSNIPVSVTFDATSLFPARFSLPALGDMVRTEHLAGKGALDVPAAPPEPRAPRTAEPWNEAFPPERNPSALRFSLRDAYAWLHTDYEPARAFSARHPGSWVCRAMYQVSDPLVPLPRSTWVLTLCARENETFTVNIHRTHGPTGETVKTDASGDRISAVPTFARGALTPIVVPLDALHVEFAREDPDAPPRSIVPMIFDASKYEHERQAFASDPCWCDQTYVLFPYIGRQISVYADTGGLAVILSPTSSMA